MMLFLLFAPVFYPLIDAGWMGPGNFQQAICSLPAPQSFIGTDAVREQCRFYSAVSDPVLRGRILRSLRESNNPEAFAELRALLEKETEPVLQADLLTLMARLVRSEHISVPNPASLRKYLTHPLPMARIGAASLQISAGHPGEVLPMLEKEKTESVPSAVFNELFSSNVSLSVAGLEGLAVSENPGVRTGALRALAASDKKADSNKLLNAAADGTEIAAQEAVAAGAARQIAATEKLARKLAANPDVRIRLRIAGSLPETSARIALLLELLQDASPLVRAEAAASLIRAERSDKVVEALAALLHDPVLQVREAAGKTLVRFTGKKLPECITSAVEDEKAHSQLVLILEACGNVAYAPLAARILTSARTAKNADVQAKAVAALESMKAESMTPLVLDAAASEFSTVRKAAAKALRVFPGAATKEALKRLMKDSSEDVALMALETVFILRDPAFVPNVTEAVLNMDKSSLYRAVACRTLCATPLQLDEKTANALKKLLLTTCIRVPMAPPAYEDDSTRACALMALFKAGQAGSKACQEAFEYSVRRLEKPIKKEIEGGFMNPTLEEYFRQIRLLRDGKEVKPKEIEPMEPEFFIQKIREKKS